MYIVTINFCDEQLPINWLRYSLYSYYGGRYIRTEEETLTDKIQFDSHLRDELSIFLDMLDNLQQLFHIHSLNCVEIKYDKVELYDVFTPFKPQLTKEKPESPNNSETRESFNQSSPKPFTHNHKDETVSLEKISQDLNFLEKEKDHILATFDMCSTEKQLRKTYLRFCKQYHPDTSNLTFDKDALCSIFDLLVKEYTFRTKKDEHLPAVLVEYDHFAFDILEPLYGWLLAIDSKVESQKGGYVTKAIFYFREVEHAHFFANFIGSLGSFFYVKKSSVISEGREIQALQWG